MVKVYLLGGLSQSNSSLTGLEGEVTVDTNNQRLHVHDGNTSGGSATATSITKLSQLAGTEQLWTQSTLTKVSQLSGDFWSTSTLTNISQLTNDKGYKTGYCTYCTHCTYCSQCSRCSSVKCSQVQCTQVKCNKVITSNCYNDCGGFPTYSNNLCNCPHC